MTRNEKDTINRRTENRHLFQRMKRGLESVRDTPHKRVLLAAYLIGAVLVWLFRAYLLDSSDKTFLFLPDTKGCDYNLIQCLSVFFQLDVEYTLLPDFHFLGDISHK